VKINSADLMEEQGGRNASLGIARSSHLDIFFFSSAGWHALRDLKFSNPQAIYLGTTGFILRTFFDFQNNVFRTPWFGLVIGARPERASL
jgi:hypothetical protein